jgi:hypothetical protein
MTPSDLLGWAVLLFVFLPVVAAFVAFRGPPALRPLCVYVLLAAWLAHTAALVGCLSSAFHKPSTGIGNQVFLLIALPIALFGLIWFGVWRAARRHAYVQSLPPDLRTVEEREDMDRAIEALRKTLEAAERRAKGWLLSSDERARLQDEITYLRNTLARAEQKRATM